MAGALIVTGSRLPTETSPGDIDVLLKDEKGRAFPERVLLFQQIVYGCLNDKGEIEGDYDKDHAPIRPFTCRTGEIGEVESFDNDASWRYRAGSPASTARWSRSSKQRRPGGFERWRMINAGRGEPTRMRLYRLDAGGSPAEDGQGR